MVPDHPDHPLQRHRIPMRRRRVPDAWWTCVPSRPLAPRLPSRSGARRMRRASRKYKHGTGAARSSISAGWSSSAIPGSPAGQARSGLCSPPGGYGAGGVVQWRLLAAVAGLLFLIRCLVAVLTSPAAAALQRRRLAERAAAVANALRGPECPLQQPRRHGRPRGANAPNAAGAGLADKEVKIGLRWTRRA